jgi:toxin ParE1/3/4
MTLAFDFHPEAQAEFAADVDWYDARETGVGGRFAEAVRAATDAAVMIPRPGRRGLVGSASRSCVRKGVTGFPYRVVYFVDRDVLTIVAVAHAQRRPGCWRDRASLSRSRRRQRSANSPQEVRPRPVLADDVQRSRERVSIEQTLFSGTSRR